MRVFASRKGFSLVELLTVIAIIAVLAGIIFPVMGMVKLKAAQTKCMTQLHEIGLALQVFKQDNRKYPDILGAVVVPSDSGGIIPFDETSTNPSPVKGLFPEYVRAARLYHCPNSKTLDMKAYERYNPGPGVVDLYSYNSYDFMQYGVPPPPGTEEPAPYDGDFRQHYNKRWAANIAAVSAGSMSAAPTDPTRDYERQLQFRTPPDTTVVTWCSWHETRVGSGTSATFSGKAPTLFLDGHADALEAGAVETLKWRVMPKK